MRKVKSGFIWKKELMERVLSDVALAAPDIVFAFTIGKNGSFSYMQTGYNTIRNICLRFKAIPFGYLCTTD
jgi:hypothetical protein